MLTVRSFDRVWAAGALVLALIAATGLAARGATPASHRDRRCARLARRDDREYREYLRKEQRRQAGCPAREVVLDRRGQATSD